jgi:pimeloyl-ACP methyl ester carboxylesterase
MTRLSPIIGRYIWLDIDDTSHRVYFEEAGQGIPMLCQHTAGTDGRQWRHLLEDPDVTSRYRVIAHDLPYHGKSLPPDGVQWWAQRYELTTDFFMGFIVALADALDLRDLVYLGCSMGGHLAGDLALNHADRFRAVIGVEGGLATHGTEESLLHNFHPRVGNEFKAAMMYSLTSPLSPEAGRREATWYYMQSAPQAHRGDLNYYIRDHDLTQDVGKIDTSKVDVYLMSGEYDWSATPDDTRAMAAQIPGAHLVEMPGLGHFPMVENYPLFRQHLIPVLDAIASQAKDDSGVA